MLKFVADFIYVSVACISLQMEGLKFVRGGAGVLLCVRKGVILH